MHTEAPTGPELKKVYWGEMVLLVCGIRAFRRLTYSAIMDSQTRFLTTLITFFMLLGAILRANGYRKWGIDAVRDSAS